MDKIYTGSIGLFVFFYYILLLILSEAFAFLLQKGDQTHLFFAIVFIITILYSFFSVKNNIKARKIILSLLLLISALHLLQDFSYQYRTYQNIEMYQLVWSFIFLMISLAFWIPKMNFYVDSMFRGIIIFVGPFLFTFIAIFVLVIMH